jgi:hypothetical protein
MGGWEEEVYCSLYQSAHVRQLLGLPWDCSSSSAGLRLRAATGVRICCYSLDKHAEALRVNDAILATAGVPGNYREAARSNRQFSVEALGEAG